MALMNDPNRKPEDQKAFEEEMARRRAEYKARIKARDEARHKEFVSQAQGRAAVRQIPTLNRAQAGFGQGQGPQPQQPPIPNLGLEALLAGQQGFAGQISGAMGQMGALNMANRDAAMFNRQGQRELTAATYPFDVQREGQGLEYANQQQGYQTQLAQSQMAYQAQLAQEQMRNQRLNQILPLFASMAGGGGRTGGFTTNYGAGVGYGPQTAAGGAGAAMGQGAPQMGQGGRGFAAMVQRPMNMGTQLPTSMPKAGTGIPSALGAQRQRMTQMWKNRGVTAR